MMLCLSRHFLLHRGQEFSPISYNFFIDIEGRAVMAAADRGYVAAGDSLAPYIPQSEFTPK